MGWTPSCGEHWHPAPWQGVLVARPRLLPISEVAAPPPPSLLVAKLVNATVETLNPAWYGVAVLFARDTPLRAAVRLKTLFFLVFGAGQKHQPEVLRAGSKQ